MLNFEEKNSRFARQKKNVLTLVLSEKFLNETKNHNPPPKTKNENKQKKKKNPLEQHSCLLKSR